jgi:uncharacterized membrane protein
MEPRGMEDMARNCITIAVLSIEILAVIIIVIAILFGTVRYVVHFLRCVPESYEHYSAQLGRSLLLGLQLLVAADVVRTVALQPTLESVVVLGLLVLVRTFLSWSTVVEIEGRWPWHSLTPLTEPEQPIRCESST